MTSLRKVKDSLENLRNAVDKLNRAIAIPKTQELVVEGTIQRFEVVVEILWKTVRRALKHEGVVINPDTPREAMIQGLSAGFLHDEVIWQSLLDKRNKTSHEYLDGAFIDESYQDILTLAPEIEKVLLFLEGRFS